MNFLKRWIVCVCIVAVAHAMPGQAADIPASPLPKDKADRALERAAQFLVTQQNAQEGFIADKPSNRTAMTALAVLAMASAGHQPTDTTTAGRAMHRALRYVLAPERQDDAGYFGNSDGSKMYGHGIITLMLAEMLGQSLDEETDRLVRLRLTKAVELILKAQQIPKSESARGGWRYTPDTKEADLSCTVWQLLALRAAHSAGVRVPKQAVDDALTYVKGCFLAPVDAQGRPVDALNGFGYTPGSSKYMSTSTTAMGMLSLQLCGELDSPIVKGSADWLLEHPPAWGNVWLFYGAYYYSQGMFQRGGQHAIKGRQIISTLLIPEQRQDGAWESSSEKERVVGAVYTTSLAVLAIAMKCHYLPIYQR